MTKVWLLNFELLSYNLQWPPSDVCDDQVLLKAYSQAITLETHSSAPTQCEPELTVIHLPHSHTRDLMVPGEEIATSPLGDQ